MENPRVPRASIIISITFGLRGFARWSACILFAGLFVSVRAEWPGSFILSRVQLRN